MTMQSRGNHGTVEKNTGVVRLTQATASWTFKPLENGVVQVTSQAHVNPGGALPGWMTNLFLVDAPFKTLLNLKRAVNKAKYKHALVAFVSEPRQ